MGLRDPPYGETHTRDFGLYPWRAFCMQNKNTTWSKLIGDKAMEIVELYEFKNNRNVERVYQKGVGYDLLSKKGNEERYIEVKGISESWKTYTWQPLHHTEVTTLQKNPENFFLYIVHFEVMKDRRNSNYLNGDNYQLFIISGHNLLNHFRILPESYALKPISQRKLDTYKILDKSVVLQPAEVI